VAVALDGQVLVAPVKVHDVIFCLNGKFSCRWAAGHKAPRLAAVLFQQLHIGDDHAPVHGFAHVVDGEQRHLHGSEGFHFDPCLAVHFGRGCADHAGVLDVEFNGHPGQADGVAQGNQVAGFFSALDACNSGNAQHIALFGRAGGDQCQGAGQHADPAPGHGHTPGVGFVSHIDHVGLAFCIKMGQDMVVHEQKFQD